MEVTDAKWIRDDGWAILQMRIGIGAGRVVRFAWEQKLIPYGLVYLGPDFEDEMPILTPLIQGHVKRFKGCTDDARVLRLVKDFQKAVIDGTFVPRDVDVPTLD